jgi:shikimate dehydrogenase
MKLFVLLGDPIKQVKLPDLFNDRAREVGLNSLMVMTRCRADSLSDVMAGLSGTEQVTGVVVTVPHKVNVAGMCDSLGPAAEACGSVNVVRRTERGGWHGDNVDGLGFVAGLRARHRLPDHPRVDIIGGGGAGVAIAFALHAQGAEVRIGEIDADRRAAVASLLGAAGTEVQVLDRVDGHACDLVVNATPLGLSPDDPLPLDLSRTSLAPGAVVADIVMDPTRTAWLEHADRLGHATHEGRHMLAAQLEPMLDFFGETRPRSTG